MPIDAVLTEWVAAYIAPGLLRPRERLPDLTVATDAIACLRWTRCTLCQGALGAFQFRVWSNEQVIVGVVLCPACQRRGAATEEAVHAMMVQRYGDDGKENDDG